MCWFPEFSTETVIAIVAVLISLASLLSTIYLTKKSKHISLTQMNAQLLFDVESNMDGSLLMLHNISNEVLKNNNITELEAVYIIRSFRAASAYYVLADTGQKLSEYRKNLLLNDKVKFMYENILKEKFLDQSVFLIKLIDQFYQSNEYKHKRELLMLSTN